MKADKYGVPDVRTMPKRARDPLDRYPTPHSIITALLDRWPVIGAGQSIWEPCAGDGRVANALLARGFWVEQTDIASEVNGVDFFSVKDSPCSWLCTNPPFKHIRPFIDHAFKIGVVRMALVCPERLWACHLGWEQMQRHRPTIWANMEWREDYLQKGGSPDRALAVAIWDSPCAETCEYQIWEKPS